MTTYLFYDIETTGLNKAFDQVLHFAAIRTDVELNEIERHDIKVKLNKDVIPAPQAVITHYIGIDQAKEGVSELEAIACIHQLMNEPGTISLGYNTLGFDDEFLRFSFYRYLLPPYTHQYANQCSRMDLYPLTIMYYLFKNSILQWPEIEGKKTLKLEHLNQSNHFVAARSHHAMVDVEVTIALAKKFLAAREMWDYMIGFYHKATDQARIRQLQVDEHYVGLLILGKLGREQHYQAPVLLLGEHTHYKNQTLWLRLDLANLQQTTLATIAENTWVIRKRWGEPGFILPNKSRFQQHLTLERRQLAEQNQAWLVQNPQLHRQIIAYHCNYLYPILPNTDIDASLYLNGFWTHEENQFCKRFHAANPQEKALMIERIQNPQIKQLALRIVGRHFFEYLLPHQQQEFNVYLARVNSWHEHVDMIDFKGSKRLTPRAALADIHTLTQSASLNIEQQALLAELSVYLQGFAERSATLSLPA